MQLLFDMPDMPALAGFDDSQESSDSGTGAIVTLVDTVGRVVASPAAASLAATTLALAPALAAAAAATVVVLLHV
jgi:hypothetical protein